MRFRRSRPKPPRETQPPKKRRRSWFGFFGESLIGFVFCAAIVAAIGLGLVMWGWSQRDHFLTQEIRKALKSKFPEAEIEFASAEFDQRGRIVIADFRLASEPGGQPIFAAPGIRITVDRDLLLKQQKVDVQTVELDRPELTIVRRPDGSWNWEQFATAGGEDAALPLIRIRDAGIVLQWEHEQFSRAMRLKIDAVDTDLIPIARHQYRFSGIGREEMLGASQFYGEIDVLHKTWDLSGELSQLRIDQPLLEAAAMISPEASRVVTQLQTGSRPAEGTPGKFARGEALEDRTVLIDAAPKAAETSLELTASLQFHSSRAAGKPPEYSAFAQLVNGRFRHPDLPVPLDQIRGSVAVDGLGLRIDDMLVASGKTSVRLAGAWGWQQGMLPAHVSEGVDVSLVNYAVTPEVRDFLPKSLQTVYDELQPRGSMSAKLRVIRKPDATIGASLVNATVHEGNVQHEMFSYPVHGIKGTITRTDDDEGPETWALDFRGLAGDRPVKVTGTVIDPGPDCETVIDITTEKIAIDEQFYRALNDKQREVMRHLELAGTADVHCVVLRKLSSGRKPIVRLAIDLYDGSMRVKAFPLAIRNISGHLLFDETGWQFTRVMGSHGETPIRGYGTVVPVGSEWKLEMNVSAKDAQFDRELYLASKAAGEEFVRVWDLLRPRGSFDLDMRLNWTTGQQVITEIPLMKLKNCEINPTAFPYRLTELESTVTVGRDHSVAFQNLTARHDQCRIETSGSFTPHAGYWQLRFEHIDVDDLFPNHEFLAALPGRMREILETARLRDPVSLAGQVEFKGDYTGSSVTAAWDGQVVLNQADLFLGLDVNDVSGTVTMAGRMDRNGVVVAPVGKLAIDSCWVMGYHVTDVHGPFVITENKMTIGSPKMFEGEETGEEWATVSREERVTGRIFGGELFLDLLVHRTPTMPYLLRCTLSRASLEQWAIESNYGQANIRGEMNGYIDLAGDAVSTRQMMGNGRLLISPAALYEVPVLFQMFQSLRFAPADDTAFRHAYAEFRVLDEKFVFDEIGLLGDTMSLFGQGHIRFDRTIDFDFVYRPPRRGGINLASQVMSRLEGVLPVLFTVDVDGTVDVPRITVNDGMRETLRGFRRLLEQTPGNIRPPKILPPPRVQIPQSNPANPAGVPMAP